jgi:hypothetical protein
VRILPASVTFTLIRFVAPRALPTFETSSLSGVDAVGGPGEGSGPVPGDGTGGVGTPATGPGACGLAIGRIPGTSTVNVAAALIASAPTPFVNTARYWLPLIA